MQYRTLAILGDNFNKLIYYKELRQYAGGVTASILMVQMDFWFSRHPDGFYKFLSPIPSHVDYVAGDSWTEELGFSEAEFRTAFDAIGIRHLSKSAFKNAENPFLLKKVVTIDGKLQEIIEEKLYCSYHDKKNGLTWYFRNHAKVDRLIFELSAQKSVKQRKKPSSVDKQSQSTVDKESQSTVDKQSQSLEMKDLNLHNSRSLSYIDKESESTFYIQTTLRDHSDKSACAQEKNEQLEESDRSLGSPTTPKIPIGQKDQPTLAYQADTPLGSKVPPPLKSVKANKYDDDFLNQNRKRGKTQDLGNYDWIPNGPWKNEQGEFRADFIAWAVKARMNWRKNETPSQAQAIIEKSYLNEYGKILIDFKQFESEQQAIAGNTDSPQNAQLLEKIKAFAPGQHEQLIADYQALGESAFLSKVSWHGIWLKFAQEQFPDRLAG